MEDRNRSRCILLAVLCVVPLQTAHARQMQVMSSYPMAEAEIDGRNAQYSVRFDGPVDHRASKLYITQNGQVIRELHPLLDSAPDVLFSSTPRLPAGSYELHWEARSMPDGDFTNGSLAFKIRP
jgi:methionine-rich copper-binding protein CopC